MHCHAISGNRTIVARHGANVNKFRTLSIYIWDELDAVVVSNFGVDMQQVRIIDLIVAKEFIWGNSIPHHISVGPTDVVSGPLPL